ncbi:mucin-1 [Selaginella moellendorffii]|uniref:mucin-1 n=1 Tax=Selaginella moellendorffii TaxID=88036 RepID=UPI000D1C8A69|nr:mucin-1 [Selaginella moellendorffii]|eukprot:XP_002977473.2 mucin-1 [Selaginella moellendorffii]
MESSGGAVAVVSGSTTSSASISSSCVTADPDCAPPAAMARVLSSSESNAPAAAEIAPNSNGGGGEATNSSSQAAAVPVPAASTMAAPPPLVLPVAQQRQPHIPQQQRIVCVPNQQAPYPHAPPSSSQGRAAKGAAVVVRHMTTAPPTTSQASGAAAAPGQFLHLQKFQQQRPYATAFFSQAQMAAAAAGGSHHLRQPHPILPMPAMQPGGATTPRPPQPAASKSQQGTQVQRIPHPVSSPRYVNAGQAAGGVMSASASPQPHKLQGVHHFRVGGASNGSVLGKSPSWLPPTGQGGGSSSMTPGESHGRDRPDALSVIINDRKVRLVSEADKSSLYSLCRRWVRNDVPRKDQMGCWDCVVPLPRPLSAAEVERVEPSEEDGDVPDEVMKSDFPVEKLSTGELLEQHISHFKNVRKRSREEIKQRIARYRPRLALCLQRDYT